MTRRQKIVESLLGGPSWEESVWAWRLSIWRCWLGHKWIEEQEMDPLYGDHILATWRGCERCGTVRNVEYL